MTTQEIYDKGLESGFFTLVMPTGADGSSVLVMTDIKPDPLGGWVICWRDITFSQPMYLHFSDLRSVVGGAQMLQYYNLWSVDEVEAFVDHPDLDPHPDPDPDPDPFWDGADLPM